MPNPINQPFTGQSQHYTERPEVKGTVEARGAVTGHGARSVLIWSTLGVVVLFAAVYLYFFA
jgi:hypothetical protein